MYKTTSELFAEQDGIEMYQGAGRGRKSCTHFLIPCAVCGRKVDRLVYRRGVRYACDECKALSRIKQKQINEEVLAEVVTPKQRQFDKAVDEIRRRTHDISKYEKAIRLAETRCEKYGSIPEAMVVIELLRLGYKVIPQQKIGRMFVDIVLPDQKIVIEVDGSLYHNKEDNEFRDHAIRYHLGTDWKIAHIPAEQIRKQITSVSKIIRMLQHQ